MTVRSYRELVAWRKAMDYVILLYRVSAEFPKTEAFGLTSQLRRAGVSIPSNIAEGQGRHSTRDFLHFLSIAHGSLNECETQVLIGERLGYLSEKQRNELFDLSAEVGRLLNGLSNALSAKINPPP